MRKTVISLNKESPKIGHRRKIIKFLWLPLTLRVKNTDIIETRWLEFAEIHQIWSVNGWYLTDGGGYETFGWVNEKFMS